MEYNQKFTEFLELFITSHLQRVESDARFPINEFLTYMFKFTFLQQAAEGGTLSSRAGMLGRVAPNHSTRAPNRTATWRGLLW